MTNTSTSRFKSSRSGTTVRTLSGAVKMQKMKEAEELRAKAKQAMTRGIFTRPDPVIAGTYYKRAAEIYKQCGENRLERLHRIASADCQRGQEAYAIAASEYTRAAELAESSDEKDGRKRSEAYQLHKNAAEAWKNLNEPAKAGESLMKAGFGLLIGVDPNSMKDNNVEDLDEIPFGPSKGKMDTKALSIILESIETHVPDPLNRFQSMRKVGKSMYEPDANTPAAMKSMRELAYQNIITAPYAHETVAKAVKILVEYREYASALYAAGGVTALLEHENTATISLSRAYMHETILQLALNDIVAADKTFMEVHLQRNSYLTSRECKLAEELIGAMKNMDYDALETCKLENRHALANLDPVLRDLVVNLHVSGISVKRRTKIPAVPSRTEPELTTPTSNVANLSQSKEPTPEDNYNEMMNIMDDMGLGDDPGNNQPPITDDFDDEIDLR